MTLWNHQTRAIELAGKEFARGAQAVCIVISTGGGKTKLAGEICRRHLEKNPSGKVLWLAHRSELVEQAYDALTDMGLFCGAIQASPSREYNPYRPIQIASIQTLLARDIVPKDITLLVVDECHHGPAKSWQSISAWYRKLKVPTIGLTATPIRADGRGFEGIMDALVVPVTMKELIRDGYLVPFDLVAPNVTLQNDQIAMRPVDAYQAHAAGRKAIVFARTLKAGSEYESQFCDAGIPCATVSGAMDMARRRQVLDAYKAGTIRVITNVGVIVEGFDDRHTSCIILARSIGSLSLYLQICGRALRCAEGKTNAIIIDLHGSCRIHGSPDDDREWCLEGDGVKHADLEQPTERFCLVCKVLLEGDSRVCDQCGIERPELAAPEVVNAKLVKYAAKLRETPEQRRAYFEKLKAVAREKGWSKWQPVVKYRVIYGQSPPKDWS